MKTLSAILIAIVFAGCKPEPHSEAPIIKIGILQSGMMLMNGTEATIDQVEKRLAQLKTEGGSVWYYREADQDGEPPPEAMQVLNLIIEKQLPISLSTKPDFSDYLGEDGLSHPRQ